MITLYRAMVVLYASGAVLGLAVTIWALVDDLGDRAAVRRPGRNGFNRRVATRQLRASLAALVTDVVLAFVGISAVINGRVPPDNQLPRLIVIAGGFALMVVVANGGLLLNQIERVRERRSARQPLG